MNELPENEKLNGELPENNDTESVPVDEYDSYETIFADPAAHGDKSPRKNGKRRIVSVIAAVLAVAVLVGGTVAVIKLIPEKEEIGGDPFEDISVLNFSSSDLDTVTVTNGHGTFQLIAEKAEKTADESASSSVTATWYVEGVDKSMVSSGTISAIASAAATISASREITEKTASECGLDAPVYTADVTSEKVGSYSVFVGEESPDGSGTYLQLSTSDKIYLVDTDAVSQFDFELLDLADLSAIPGMTVESDMKSYADENGSLIAFDSITVTGVNFPSPLVIEMNTDDAVGAYLAYKVTAPTTRVAENVDDILKMFTNGLSVTGAYAYDVSSASLAAVGLDNPYMTAVIKVGSHERTFRIAKVDDTSCAVVVDDSVMIKKVAASSISFLDYNAEGFYGTWVWMRSINTLSNFTVETGGETYSFDIVYDDSEDAEETYVISCNGVKLTAQYFQNFYQYFVGLMAADFITGSVSDAPDMRVVITYSADGSTEELTFTKSNDTKYQYALDGVPLGRITSAHYNKMVGYLKRVAAGNDIS